MASMDDLIASTFSTFFSQPLEPNTEENKPAVVLKKFEDLTDEEVQEGIKDVMQSSTYTGSNRDSLIQALNDSLSGKMLLTQAAAHYGIPFSTIQPYMKKLQIKLGIYDANAKKPRMSTKRKQDETGDDSNQESATPKKNRKKPSSLPGYIPFRQISIPDHWLQFPEKIKTSVMDTVSNCNYDDNDKKMRLYQAVLDVMIDKKTLKAAAVDNVIPFTTLQSYFHRSRIVLEQLMEADKEVQKTKPPSDAAESTSDEQPPALECFAQTSNDKNAAFMDQALAMLATLPPEQQNYFTQMLLTSATGDAAQSASLNNLTSNLSMGNDIIGMMNWLMAQSFSPANLGDFLQTSRPCSSDGMNISPSSTTSSKSSSSGGTNILEELAAMKPIKLEACVNVINNQRNVVINESFDKKLITFTAFDIHHQSIIFDREKLANNLIPYFVYHCKDFASNEYEMIINALKISIIDRKFMKHGALDMVKYITSIQNLMKHISQAFPVFLYQIQPEESNVATYKDYVDGKALFHDSLLSQPPNSLMELIRICDLQLIVKYLKPFIVANVDIDEDLTKFLVLAVIKDRSLPEMYDETEYKLLHERILMDVMPRSK